MTNSCNKSSRSIVLIIFDNLEVFKNSTNLINHSLLCRSTSYGAGLFKPITFFTPLDNHSSCLTIETIIPDINRVEIA